jgi:hypothetical protein
MTQENVPSKWNPLWQFAENLSVVIPGRRQRVRAKRGPMTGSAAGPESKHIGFFCFLDSGFALSARPGMTTERFSVNR